MGTPKCISYMAGTLGSSTDTSMESNDTFSGRVEAGEQSTMSPRETLRETSAEAEAEPVRHLRDCD
jgi:hypothetical protein